MAAYEYRYLAQAYGSGDYGSCSYTTSASCSTTTKATGSGSSSLTNTGLMVALIVTIACIIIFVAILVRWWRRPRKPVQKDASTNTNQDSKNL